MAADRWAISYQLSVHPFGFRNCCDGTVKSTRIVRSPVSLCEARGDGCSIDDSRSFCEAANEDDFGDQSET